MHVTGGKKAASFLGQSKGLNVCPILILKPIQFSPISKQQVMTDMLQKGMDGVEEVK